MHKLLILGSYLDDEYKYLLESIFKIDESNLDAFVIDFEKIVKIDKHLFTNNIHLTDDDIESIRELIQKYIRKTPNTEENLENNYTPPTYENIVIPSTGQGWLKENFTYLIALFLLIVSYSYLFLTSYIPTVTDGTQLINSMSRVIDTVLGFVFGAAMPAQKR